MEKEPDTGVNQVLPQIAALVSVDLGTCIVEVVVFGKRAPLRIEKSNLRRRPRPTPSLRDLLL